MPGVCLTNCLFVVRCFVYRSIIHSWRALSMYVLYKEAACPIACAAHAVLYSRLNRESCA